MPIYAISDNYKNNEAFYYCVREYVEAREARLTREMNTTWRIL